jgi:hypothetical protein
MTVEKNGKAFSTCWACSPSSTTNLRKERQQEEIRRAKAHGVYKGRTPTIDAGMVLKPGAEVVGGTGGARASVYWLLQD